MYSLPNVILTGTHTHSAPGGHLVDFLLDISILGFSVETYEAYVAGITRVRREGTGIIYSIGKSFRISCFSDSEVTL